MRPKDIVPSATRSPMTKAVGRPTPVRSLEGIVLFAVLGMETVVAQKEPLFEVVSARAIPERNGIPVGFGSHAPISNARLSWTNYGFLYRELRS